MTHGDAAASGSKRSNVSEEFQQFRRRLIGLTDVTHDYFNKLVKQLEAGFDDLDKVTIRVVYPVSFSILPLKPALRWGSVEANQRPCLRLTKFLNCG